MELPRIVLITGRTLISAGGHLPNSPKALTRNGMRCCGAEMAPHRLRGKVSYQKQRWTNSDAATPEQTLFDSALRGGRVRLTPIQPTLRSRPTSVERRHRRKLPDWANALATHPCATLCLYTDPSG
jgi:hypothetical protein